MLRGRHGSFLERIGLEQTCFETRYTWFVEQKGCWISTNTDGEIIHSQMSPSGEGRIMDNGWFAAQKLLDYTQLITNMDYSCKNLVGDWPDTLVHTAKEIDALSKTLANFMDNEHEVGRFFRKIRFN